jgi:hypothetical protein
MSRFKWMAVLAVLAGLGLASVAQAQLFVRAPFVRVRVDGPYWNVRAPFVNIGGPGYYYNGYYGPPVYVVPPPRVIVPAIPPAEFTPPPPTPAPNPDQEPPQPVQPNKVPTLEEFANSFKPKAGSYEVTLVNPVTKQPTPVRFTLPEGTPQRVQVRRHEIEFHYGLRHFVRIEFDRDGAQVISR